jgi:hypothetical protein
MHKKQEVKELLNDMLEREVIRPSNSPWSSPLVLVKKKDNTKRLCVDFRKVNEITKKDAYTIPGIDDTLDTLHGARYFSCVIWPVAIGKLNCKKKTRKKRHFQRHMGYMNSTLCRLGLREHQDCFNV